MKSHQSHLTASNRVITIEGTKSADFLINPKAGSIFEKINKERFFGGLVRTGDEGMEAILADSSKTFWIPQGVAIEYLQKTKDFCGAKFGWASEFPDSVSMALPKTSPYRQFFDRTLMKLKERGGYWALQRRWANELPRCPFSR